MSAERIGRRVFVLGACAAATSCDASRLRLEGAGATLPQVHFERIFADFERAHTDVRIQYRGVGSGGGIRQLLAGTVDFAATDLPLEDEDRALLDVEVLEVPVVLFGLGIAVNLGGLRGLRLSRASLAGLLLGEIRRWDDPRVVADNPGAPLPPRPVLWVARSDGSGSTALLARLCASIRPEAAATLGSGRFVAWPTGVGARGSGGVARRVLQTQGAVGYVEATQARRLGLALAAVENRRGELVLPTRDSIAAAASGGPRAEGDVFDVSEPGAYPLVSCSSVIVRERLPDRDRGAALARLLFSMLRPAEPSLVDSSAVPLPPAMAARARHALRRLRHGELALLPLD